MAGTIPLSMTQQFDVYGKPLAGGQLYIIQAGTVSTPQDAFQDTNLTIKQTYPMTLDAAGRVPQFFLDNSINSTVKIRLQDRYGVVQLAADSVLVIGPSGGSGGGGVTVDPTTLIQTGNMIMRYGVGVLTGYVRMNGLTIGSSTSSATMPEGARPECLALFQYLWNTDPNLQLYSGTAAVPRGASASIDWGANKNIATPDWRGYAPAGLDDMGNSPAGRLTPAYFGSDAITLGHAGGNESFTLGLTQIPNLSWTGNINVSGSFGKFVALYNNPTGVPVPSSGGVASVYDASGPGGISYVSSLASSGGNNITLNNSGGQGHRTLGPRKLCTFYLKL